MADKLGINVKIEFEAYNTVDKKLKDLLGKLKKANKLDIIVDKDKVAKQINEISKQFENLKAKVGEQNQKVKETNKSYEIQLGLAKSLEKAEERARKAQNEQSKYIKQANAEREKALQYEQKTRTTIEQKEQNEQTKQIKQANIERERALQYEQKIRMAIEQKEQLERNNVEKLKQEIALTQKKAQIEIDLLRQKFSGSVNTTELNRLDSAIKNLSVTTPNVKNQMKMLQTELKGVGKAARVSGKESLNMGEMFKMAIKKFSVWISATTIFFGTIRKIKEMATTVTELDTAIVSLGMVTDETNSNLDTFRGTAIELAKEMALLTKNVIESTTEFARAGYSISDAMELAKDAVVGANIGVTDVANSTKFIVAGMKAFNFEASESTRIIDVLFNVSRNSAIQFEGIGEGFLNSASSLREAGASLEEASALITGANLAIQDPAKAGTALKTISARLRAIGEEGEEVFPKLESSLLNIGVAVRKSDGAFRNIYDILKDVSIAFENIDSEFIKQDVMELLAGKRQINILQGLINNFDEADKSLANALNSAGTAAQANERYLESIAAKINILKSTADGLYTSLLSGGTYKKMIEFLTNVVQGMDNLVETTGSLVLVLELVAITIGAFKFKVLTSAIYSMATAMAYGTGILASFQAAWLASPLGVVTLAIGATILAINEYSNSVQNAKKAQEEFNDGLKEFNDLLIEGSSKELDNQINKVEELMNKYDELQKQIDSNVNDPMSYYGQTAYLEKEQQKITDELRKMGIYSAEAKKITEAIKRMNEAKEETLAFEQKLMDFDKAEKNKEEFNSVKQLADRYEELNKVEGKSEQQKQTLSTITNLLKSKVSFLTIGIDDNKNAYISNIDVLDDYIDKQENVLTVQQNNAIAALNIEKNALSVKIAMMGMEMKWREAVNKMSEQDAEIWNKKRPDKSYVGKNADALATLMRETEKSINEIDERINNVIGKLNIPTTSSDTSTSTSTTEETYTKINSVYLSVEERLKNINYELERQKLLSDDTEGKERISALLKINNLYSEKQDILKETNKLKENEIAEVAKGISSFVKFDDRKNVIEVLRKVNDEEKNLIDRYSELRDSVDDTKLSILQLDTEQRKNILTMKEMSKKVTSLTLENEKQAHLGKIVKEQKEEVEKLIDALDELVEKNEKVVNGLKDMVEATDSFDISEFKDNIRDITFELDKLDGDIFEGASFETSTDGTRSGLSELKSEIINTANEIKEFNETKFDSKSDLKDLIENQIDYSNELKDKVKDIDDVIRDVANLYKEQEASLENQIDLLKEKKKAIIDGYKERLSTENLFDIENFKDELSLLTGELESVSSNINGSPEDFAKEILDINAKIIDLKDSNLDSQEKLNKAIETEIEMNEKLDKNLKSINNEIRDREILYNSEKKVIQKNLEESNKLYDTQIKTQKEKLELLDEEYEKEDRLLKLREKDEEISKALDDKRFSYITESGEEILTYDRDKVAELRKDKDDILKQFEREDIKQAINDEIDRLEIAKEKKSQIYEKELKDLEEKHQRELNALNLHKDSLDELKNVLLNNTNNHISELEELHNTEITNQQDKLDKIKEIHQQELNAFNLYRDGLDKLNNLILVDINKNISELEELMEEEQRKKEKKLEELKETNEKELEEAGKHWDNLIKGFETGSENLDNYMNEWYTTSLGNLSTYADDIEAKVRDIIDTYNSLQNISEAGDDSNSNNSNSDGSYTATITHPDGATETVTIKDGRVVERDKLRDGTVVHTAEGDFVYDPIKDIGVPVGDGGDGYTGQKIYKYHSGGIVGENGKIPDAINRMFNVKPNEQLVKALKGELMIPPNNIMNNFIPNLRNLAGSNGEVIQKNYNFKDITIKSDNATHFLDSIDWLIQSENK